MKSGPCGYRFALGILVLSACAQPGERTTRNAPERRPETHPARQHVEESLGAAEPGQNLGARELSAAFRSAAGRVLPALVYISVEKEAGSVQASGSPDPFRRFFDLPQGPVATPPQRGAGSGFIISEDGLILTNHHVVVDATRIGVRLLDGQELDGTLVGSDAATDVALVRVDPPADETLPIAPLGEADSLLVGDWVLALGNPLGLDFTVTAGIVSAKGRTVAGDPSALQSFIQTDAAINPGNSGGPLIDLEGRVVGINSAIIGGGDRFVGYGLSIPIDIARRVKEDLLAYGYVKRPRLGVGVTDVTAVDAEAYGLDEVAGAEVNTVEGDSPADEAGLEVGDVIVELDGTPVKRANDLTTALVEDHPGDDVRLAIIRDGKREEVTATLGEFPHEESPAARESGSDAPERLIGFSVTPLTRELAQRFGYEGPGVVVSDVARFGPAANAGIRPGQLIRSVNREPVDSPEAFRRVAGRIDPGEVVSLRLVDPQVGETIINYRAR